MNRFLSIVLICLSLFLGLNGCGSEDVDLTAPAITLDTVNGLTAGGATGALKTIFNASDLPLDLAGTMEDGAQITATVNTTTTLTSIKTAGSTWSGTIDSLAEGINVVTVTANDRRGNLSNLSFVINYDSIKPTVSFDQFFTPTSSAVQTFGGLVEAGATVSVISTETSQSCGPVDTNNGIWSCSFSGLIANDTIVVTATDIAGNTNTASQSISLVTNAPLLTIDEPPPTNDNSTTLSGDLASGYSVQVTPPVGVTAGVVDTTTTPGRWSCGLSNLQLGNNVVKVSFGNDVVTGGTIVQYDAIGPQVTSVTPAASATVTAADVTSVSAVFSERLDSALLDGTSLTLKASDETPVAGTVTYYADTRTLSLEVTLLQPGNYTATLGANNIKDLVQNSFAGYSWTFTVQ